jgi:hypothetical protein
VKTSSLSPNDFRLSSEDMAAMKKRPTDKSPPPRKPKREIEFYPFPAAVVDALIRANYAPAWTLAAVIYKTWYRGYKKLNPVLVTSAILAKYGLTRHQKSRALKILEDSDQYIVERSANRNPLVMLKWKLVKEPISSNTK